MRPLFWRIAGSYSSGVFALRAARRAVQLRVAARARPGEPAEHGAAGQSARTGIVEIEDAADHLAGREKPGDALVAGIQHLALARNLHAAEGEGDAAGHGIGFKGRRIDRAGP